MKIGFQISVNKAERERERERVGERMKKGTFVSGGSALCPLSLAWVISSLAAKWRKLKAPCLKGTGRASLLAWLLVSNRCVLETKALGIESKSKMQRRSSNAWRILNVSVKWNFSAE